MPFLESENLSNRIEPNFFYFFFNFQPNRTEPSLNLVFNFGPEPNFLVACFLGLHCMTDELLLVGCKGQRDSCGLLARGH
jgi:hypothetical protein